MDRNVGLGFAPKFRETVRSVLVKHFAKFRIISAALIERKFKNLKLQKSYEFLLVRNFAKQISCCGANPTLDRRAKRDKMEGQKEGMEERTGEKDRGQKRGTLG